jgi:hypothetical protein
VNARHEAQAAFDAPRAGFVRTLFSPLRGGGGMNALDALQRLSMLKFV